MSTLVLENVPPAPRRPIAPLWHTLSLLLLFLGMAAWGAILQHRVAAHASAMPRPSSVLPLYLSLMAMEWGLVLYVVKGDRKSVV